MRASTYLTVVIVMGVSAAGPLACGGTVAVSSNSGSGGATAASSSTGTTGTATSTGTTGTATSTASSTTASSTTSSTSSSSTTSSSTTSSTSSSSGAPAATFPFPKVTFGNGPLITAPKIVTVTFPGDSMTAPLQTFGDQLTASAYWQTITSGLCGNGSTCIGAGTGSWAQAGAAPGASYVDYPGGTAPAGQPANTLQPYLQSLISALPASQQPTADTLYVFYFPTSTTLSLDGQASCAAFGGYHNSMMVGAQQVYYAIVPECSPSDAGPHLTVLEETTFAASHEVLEAATDSLIPGSQGGRPTGYYIDELLQSSYPWLYMGDGELADLCVDQLGFGQDETTEGGFTVQRTWSIANAAAGDLDPCVPSNGKVYFNAFPTVSAVIVSAVGASTTFEVDALALGNEPEWTVAIEDLTGDLFKSSTTYLSFAIAGGTTENDVGVVAASSGAKLAVTVTMLADPSKLADSPGWAQGLVLSLNGTNPSAATSGSYWPFLVMTQEVANNYGITMMDRIPSGVLARMREQAHAALTRPGRPRFLDRVVTMEGPKAPQSFTP